MKQTSDPHQRLRLGDAPLVVATDPACQRLLRYVDYSAGGRGGRGGGVGSVKVDAALFGERDGVQVRFAPAAGAGAPRPCMLSAAQAAPAFLQPTPPPPQPPSPAQSCAPT
jgi:hypothetical protein